MPRFSRPASTTAKGIRTTASSSTKSGGAWRPVPRDGPGECRMSKTRDPRGLRDAAVVGLGQMGRGIARNLDRAGRLAAAWDANPEALQRAGLSGAVALAAPGTLAGVKAVLFVVPGSAEIRTVLADGGLLRA